jgi:two-component system alkaline phosphatase synthesis response regulator PhoP
MYHILFITDDYKQKKTLKSSLLTRGFTVNLVESSEVMNEGYTAQRADATVLDLEGLKVELPKLVRKVHQDTVLKDAPVVLLIPEAQLGSLDYNLGYDDYLTLPLSETRFSERLKFLMWRLHKVGMDEGFRCGDLFVDFERYEVKVKNELIDLTYKEFELLKFLILNPHKVFTREVLLDKVWGYDYYGGTRTVDVHIRRLRAKIEAGGAVYVETVRNVGYKFEPKP